MFGLTQEMARAVRDARAADPKLGMKKFVAKLKEEHPDWPIGAKEIREALKSTGGDSPDSPELRAKTVKAERVQEQVASSSGASVESTIQWQDRWQPRWPRSPDEALEVMTLRSEENQKVIAACGFASAPIARSTC